MPHYTDNRIPPWHGVDWNDVPPLPPKKPVRYNVFYRRPGWDVWRNAVEDYDLDIVFARVPPTLQEIREDVVEAGILEWGEVRVTVRGTGEEVMLLLPSNDCPHVNAYDRENGGFLEVMRRDYGIPFHLFRQAVEEWNMWNLSRPVEHWDISPEDVDK